MDIGQIEGKDLRKKKDLLPLALRVVELRSNRLNVDLTVGDIVRASVVLMYECEVELLRTAQEKVFFDIEELS